MQNFLYEGYQIVEVLLQGGNNSTEFSFPDLPYLRPNDATIVAIEAYTDETVPISPNSVTCAELAIIKNSFLTLHGNMPLMDEFGVPIKENGKTVYGTTNGEFVQAVPMLRLNQQQGTTATTFNRDIFRLYNASVDFQKSKIEMPSVAGNANDRVLIFGVYYNVVK